jgi:hypothetical protein
MHVEITMQTIPIEMVHVVEGNLRQIIGVRQLIRN